MKAIALTRLQPTAIVLAVSLTLGASVAFAADERASSGNNTNATQATPNKAYRGVRASEMIGMSVRNQKGDSIGQISDMIVDMNSGDVRYAMLKFDPGIFKAEKLFAVPTTELRFAADRNDVVYKMSEERLERAAIEHREWNDTFLDNPDRLAKLDKAWGIKQPTRGARAHRASDLIGKDVNNRSGDKIGEIQELVVNMARQKVHYAVLEFDPSWAAPDKHYAFPLRAFNLTDDKDELVLDVDKSKIQAMKEFPQNRYENLSGRIWVADIDRYFVTILPAASTSTTAKADTASPASLFATLDDDKNGSLDKAEVKDSADVDRNWTRFDKDGDGRISQKEFTTNYTIEPKR